MARMAARELPTFCPAAPRSRISKKMMPAIQTKKRRKRQRLSAKNCPKVMMGSVGLEKGGIIVAYPRFP